MGDVAVSEGALELVRRADQLVAEGQIHPAIDLLSSANRAHRCSELEGALVRIRRDGCAAHPPPRPPADRSPVVGDPGGGTLHEVDAADLTVASLRTGLARSGCVLVRGLVPSEGVARLVAGIDASIGAYDASIRGEAVDPDWYTPFPMPDLISPAAAGTAVTVPDGAPPAKHFPARPHRRVVREAGGLWTADSPRMLFELLELVDDSGIGAVMTEFLGERPFLSANKCTLRRVPPQETSGGWHQDGAFLGEDVGAFNFWLALTTCGRDAPGLDLVPRRFDRVLRSDDDAYFAWSLSDQAVLAAADGVPIVSPEFAAGDALLFDHRLVHRTGASASMTLERHAIESWFFAPSAFPASQLPLVY